MPMKDADVTSTIEYKGGDGLHRTATPSPTDVHFPGTDDPVWRVVELETGNSGDFDWLIYYAWGHEVRRCKWHCSYDNGLNRIKVWLEFETLDGDDNHDDNHIDFLDPDNIKWRAQTGDIYKWPARPVFKLTRFGPA